MDLNTAATQDFQAHFDSHVTPDLEAAIRGYACLIRCEVCDYTEAFDQVMEYAWRRGAYLFDNAQLGQLLDWVGNELSRAIRSTGSAV